MAEEEKKQKTLKPKRPTAQKRDIQNDKKRAHTRTIKKELHTAKVAYQASVQEDKTKAKTLLSKVFSLLDKGVKRGVLKLNKASRDKRKLSLLLK